MKSLNIVVTSLFFIIFSFVTAQKNRLETIDSRWKTDTSKRIVDLDEFWLGAPRDAFKVLENPPFIEKIEALATYFKHEPVISVTIKGKAKGYPLNVLTYHEVANDYLGKVPILATYCPLCNAGIIYDRRLEINGEQQILDFAVSGMLRSSDMVIWDKQTESWWQQLTGEALVGDLTGTTLKIIPSMIVSMEEFFRTYPKGKVLSRKTGIGEAEQRYGTQGYVRYDSIGKDPRLFGGKIDQRLPAMERVVDIRSGDKFKIYTFTKAAEEEIINDRFEGKDIVVFYKSGTVSALDTRELKNSKDIGSVTVFNANFRGSVLEFYKGENGFVDDHTGSVWDITGKCIEGASKGKRLRIEPHGNHFAFAWLAFHPDTEIYGEN
jgi:hypothetical protein